MNGYAATFGERYEVALLADAAFRASVALNVPSPGIRPLDLRSKAAGPVVTVEANNDLVAIMEAVHVAEPESVVVIADHAAVAALIGDIIGTEAVRKRLAGFVVDGYVRDVTTLVDIGLPVFCRGSFPVGPLKLAPEQRGIGVVNTPVAIGDAAIAPGDWVFGDADGVVFLAADDLDAVFAEAAVAAEQEAALVDAISDGLALADALALEEFLEQRRADPAADFNAHRARIKRAI